MSLSVSHRRTVVPNTLTRHQHHLLCIRLRALSHTGAVWMFHVRRRDEVVNVTGCSCDGVAPESHLQGHGKHKDGGDAHTLEIGTIDSVCNQ
jgi:hypothetical protein